MTNIKSRGNKTTEKAFPELLKNNKIKGWRRHYKIVGKPDFVFLDQKIAFFIDGCFWHACPKCFRIPKSNKIYWEPKIKRNKKRDRIITKELKKRGWIVLRIKEHELKFKNKLFSKVKKYLN